MNQSLLCAFSHTISESDFLELNKQDSVVAVWRSGQQQQGQNDYQLSWQSLATGNVLVDVPSNQGRYSMYHPGENSNVDCVYLGKNLTL